MFVDKVKVTVQAGKGGDGMISFRREKYINRGGPDGGDGGDGGDVVFEASRNQNTLSSFRYKKKLTAKRGNSGYKKKQHGKNGEDLSLKVPIGTVISSLDGEVLADLVADGQQATIAHGGRGGFGNAHFVSSTRQAPRMAEKGEPGESLEVILELKMIADVGLVGLPNAGKSTLLSRISNAKPQIANYPFTTIRPNLGMADIDGSSSLLFADIPGLIKGASRGKGLGDEFLRHVERTKLLVHLVDVYQDDIEDACKTIQKELAEYSKDLARRPTIVALNKIDGVDKEIVDEQKTKLRRAAKTKKVYVISAHSGEGVKELLYAVGKKVATIDEKTKEEQASEIPVITLKEDDGFWEISKTKNQYIVTGKKIESFARRTDFSNREAVSRLKDIMKKTGISKELEKKGVKPGDKIQFGEGAIGSVEF